MFDTLVRMTAALRLRIPGISEDHDSVDALPITLMSQAETEIDASSLVCTSEEPDCEGGISLCWSHWPHAENTPHWIRHPLSWPKPSAMVMSDHDSEH